MPYRFSHRKKPNLSAYQKEIRLLTRLAMFIGFLLAGAVLWLVNSVNFQTR